MRFNSTEVRHSGGVIEVAEAASALVDILRRLSTPLFGVRIKELQCDLALVELFQNIYPNSVYIYCPRQKAKADVFFFFPTGGRCYFVKQKN